MSVLVPSLQGRFGNQVMQFLFTYAFAHRIGMEFQCNEWIGERIFALPEYKRPWAGAHLERANETDLMVVASEADLHMPDTEFRGYAQLQQCMLYTKRQAQKWLTVRTDIASACGAAIAADDGESDRVVCHRRVGDYIGYGYPVVAEDSYRHAAQTFGLRWDGVTILSEEDPTPHKGYLPDELGFVVDFYRMMMAPTLLRSNSSFSWLAALLGNGLVMSPIIEGLEGGKEHFCRFVPGNWPRFCNLSFVEDLHVAQ